MGTGALRRNLACIVAVVAVSGSGSVAGAAVTPGRSADDVFGLNTQTLMTRSITGDPFPVSVWPAYLGAMAAQGLRTVRTDVEWFNAEPAAPDAAGHHYVWTELDESMSKLVAAGLRWTPIFDTAPSWASGGGGHYAPPTEVHIPDFQAFIAAFIDRYGPQGSFWAGDAALAARVAPTEFEIWSEQNTYVHWGDRPPDPAAYIALYKAARATIAARGLKAIVGGLVWGDADRRNTTWPDGFAYAKRLADLGMGPVDGVALHPYSGTALGIFVNVRRFATAFAGLGPVPLYVNEFGWSAAREGEQPAAHFGYAGPGTGPVSDASRAGTMSLVADGLTASDCHVDQVVPYDLVERENESDPKAGNYLDDRQGVFRKTGAAPTQTALAFAAAAARMRAGTAPPGPAPLCAPATARSIPLALDLAVTRTGARCWGARAGYRDFPVELLTVHLRAAAGIEPTAATDAFGEASLCLPADAPTDQVSAWAEAGPTAVSAVLTCGASTCEPVRGTGGGGPGGGGGRGGTDAAALVATRQLACLLGGLRVGARRPAAAARRGLRLSARPCAGIAPAASVRLGARLLLGRRAARALRIGGRPRRRSARVEVGRLTGRVGPTGSAVFALRFNRGLRARIARARVLVLTLRLDVRDPAGHARGLSRRIVLRR